MEREAEYVLPSFKFAADGDNAKFNNVTGKLDAHFVTRTNVIHEKSFSTLVCNRVEKVLSLRMI
jgi:hypothetical protein